MADAAAALEPMVRFGAFVGVFAAVALWEALAPRRSLQYRRAQRWPQNLALIALNAVILRLLAPGAALGVALAGQARGWGWLNAVALPGWIEILLALLLLDLAVYFQHRLFHAVPAFWRLHRVHHADIDYDVTTGLRFHPLEILLSLGIKCAVIAVLGPPAIAVLAFEVILNATAMFNHANARLPLAVDRWLRRFIVTPDMHRVHHSVLAREMNRNFGFNLPWWDRLFGTYCAQPAAGHGAMRIGIDGLQAPEERTLLRLLMQPLRNVPASDPIEGSPRSPLDFPTSGGAGSFQMVADVLEIEGEAKQEKTGLLCSDKARKDFEALRAAIKSGEK